jgi:hypothetical protein
MREPTTGRDLTHEKKGGRPMGVFLILEASQPCGKSYRLGLGRFLHPHLASMLAVISRLL